MVNIDPILWKDKVNSPELLAFLKQYGEEHYLSAEEINELRDKITKLILNAKEYEVNSNKSNFVTDADSTVKFPTWAAITLWIKEKLNAALPSKTSPVDTDVFIIGDNSDSGKTKKITFSNVILWLSGLFQIKDDQIEIGTNSSVQNSWHGKTVLFTSNCIVTIPSSLPSGFGFVFFVMPTVTVTWAITSPHTWLATPAATFGDATNGITGHLMKRGNTNTIILSV